MIYCPGAVTAEQILAVAGEVEVHAPEVRDETPPESLPSPGVGIRHYAPNARVVLYVCGGVCRGVPDTLG